MYETLNPLEQNDGLFPSYIFKKDRFPSMKQFCRRNLLDFSEELDDLLSFYERDLLGNVVRKDPFKRKKDLFTKKDFLGGLENDEKKFGFDFRM